MGRVRQCVETFPMPTVLAGAELRQPLVERFVRFVAFLVVEVPTRIPVERFSNDRDDSFVGSQVFHAVVLTDQFVAHLAYQHVAQRHATGLRVSDYSGVFFNVHGSKGRLRTVL